MRLSFFLLLIIAAAAVTASAQPDSRTTIYKGPVRTALPCRGGDLSVRHVTEDAAMGGVNTIDYAFKNKSSSSCTLIGYPRFELLDKLGNVRPRGRAINTRQMSGEETKYTPQPVTIFPGTEARFRVYYNSGGAGYLGKPCPVSGKVRITAPGTTRGFILRKQIRACGRVQVYAMRKELRE
jgi:hypothetical protein